MTIFEELIRLEKLDRANRNQLLELHHEWQAKHYWPVLREIQERCAHEWKQVYPVYGSPEPYMRCTICRLEKDK